MKVLHFNLHEKFKQPKEEITACIGYFDGLHLGHQKLIKKVMELASSDHTKKALITFSPDPWVVLKHLENIPHITPMKHRIELGEEMGLDYWIILHFDRELAHLSVEEFHERVLNCLHLKTLVCGFDYHYGNKGLGDVHTLKKQDVFQVEVIEEVSSDDKKISSTRIEELLTSGNIEKANEFLGRAYEIRGIIRKGRCQGRKHGFPTANLEVCDHYLPLGGGVYIGEVYVKGTWHQAMINIGHNPTYNFQKEISIEAHILNFDEDIYGEQVRYRFLSFIRAEKKFSDVNELCEQLRKDLHATKQYFKQGSDKYATAGI